MSRFIEGLDRTQTTLLPECIDDYVDDDSPVRAIEAFIDMLDLTALGFDVEPEATGRPGYHPATMLKLYTRGLEWQPLPNGAEPAATEIPMVFAVETVGVLGERG